MAFAMAIVGVSVAWDGYVLSILWRWFAVPLFHLPVLTIAQAIGVSVIVALLTKQYVPSKKGDDTDWGALMYPFFAPATLLLIGYIVK